MQLLTCNIAFISKRWGMQLTLLYWPVRASNSDSLSSIFRLNPWYRANLLPASRLKNRVQQLYCLHSVFSRQSSRVRVWLFSCSILRCFFISSVYFTSSEITLPFSLPCSRLVIPSWFNSLISLPTREFTFSYNSRHWIKSAPLYLKFV